MKNCKKCKEEKNISDFGSDKTTNDGLSSKCKDCQKEKSKIYRENNKEKIIKEIYEKYEKIKNIDTTNIVKHCNNCGVNKPLSEFYPKKIQKMFCKECIKKKRTEFCKLNRKILKDQQAIYYSKNKHIINEKVKKKLRKSDKYIFRQRYKKN